jgi:predicted ABC-type ATPase
LADPAGELLGADHPITKKLAAGGTLSSEEKDTLRQAASDARGGGKPQALFLAGGAASGKSSAIEQSPELVPPAAVKVDPDAFKQQLPEYQPMVDAGERYAATGVHEESADLAKRVQEEARELGLNVMYDGAGDSQVAQRDQDGNITTPGKFAGKLTQADKDGYDVSSLYVNAPTNTAVVRAVRRAEETGRFMPVPKLRAQHATVSQNFPEIAALPFVKQMKVYDTSGNEPQLIAHGAGGNLTHDDPELMKQFVDKASESQAPQAVAA